MFSLLWLSLVNTVFAASPPNQLNSLVLAARATLLPRLKDELYDTHIAPEYPAWTAVDVSIWPIGIRHTHDEQETIRVNTWMQLTWLDPRLQWDAAAFLPKLIDLPTDSNITFNGTFVGKHTVNNSSYRAGCGAAPPLPVRVDEIWTPYISVYEMTWTAAAPAVFVHQDANVRCDGRVRMTGMFVDDTHCFMNTRYFPFDKQACPLTFYAIRRVLLRHRIRYSTEEDFEKIFDQAQYETGDWQMFTDFATINHTFNKAEQTIYEHYGESDLKYRFILQRKPWQHVLDWIVPPILLSTSSVFSLYLGCDRSERYSFGGSVVVTLTLMLSSLREHLPVALDGYPILASLYLALLSTNIMATLFSGLPEYVNEVGRRWKNAQEEEQILKTCVAGNRILLANNKPVVKNARNTGKIPAALKERISTRTQFLAWRTKLGGLLYRSTESLLLEALMMLFFLSVQASIIGWAAYQWHMAELNNSVSQTQLSEQTLPTGYFVINLEKSDQLF